MQVAQVVKNDRRTAPQLLYGSGIERLSPSTEDAYCVMRGTIPPGVSVPLHNHEDVESFYLLSGEAEALVQTESGLQWQTLRPGDFIHFPGRVKHAWRNPSSEPVSTLIICTPRLGRALEEMERLKNECGTPFASQAAFRRLLEICDRYGYWLGSPEENAAVGIKVA
jgi:quercetin dioxygenase-like cupin family protein